MTRYILNVPVEYTTRDGGTKTTFRRVGSVFENTRKGAPVHYRDMDSR